MIKDPFLQGFLVFSKNIESIIDSIKGETIKALKENVSVIISSLLGIRIQYSGKNKQAEDLFDIKLKLPLFRFPFPELIKL